MKSRRPSVTIRLNTEKIKQFNAMMQFFRVSDPKDLVNFALQQLHVGMTEVQRRIADENSATNNASAAGELSSGDGGDAQSTGAIESEVSGRESDQPANDAPGGESKTVGSAT